MGRRPGPTRRAVMLCGLLLLPAAAAPSRGADGSIVVDRNPPASSTRTYDPAHPPAELPATQPSEAGAAVSRFSCAAVVSGEVVAGGEKDGAAEAVVRVDAVKVTIDLSTTIWLQAGAPPKVVAHEDGHRAISERFYAGAGDIAAAAAKEVTGKNLYGRGATAAEAAQAALRSAADRVNAQYMAAVRDPSQKVQEAYDRITAHGTNDVPEEQAIARAIDEVRKEQRARRVMRLP